MKKPTFEDYIKLIGELTNRGPGGHVHISYTPARQYNGFGESEGYDHSDWGFVVGAKLSGASYDTTAQDKDLLTAMRMLSEELVKSVVEAQERRKEDSVSAKKKMNDFLEKFKPEAPPSTGSPYR